MGHFLKNLVTGESLAIQDGMIFGRPTDPNEARTGQFDNKISRRHFKIEIDEDGQAYLIDLASTNGTSVNHKKVTANKKYKLNSGDIINFGSQVLCYEKNKTNAESTAVFEKSNQSSLNFTSGHFQFFSEEPSQHEVVHQVSSSEKNNSSIMEAEPVEKDHIQSVLEEKIKKEVEAELKLKEKVEAKKVEEILFVEKNKNETPIQELDFSSVEKPEFQSPHLDKLEAEEAQDIKSASENSLNFQPAEEDSIKEIKSSSKVYSFKAEEKPEEKSNKAMKNKKLKSSNKVKNPKLNYKTIGAGLLVIVLVLYGLVQEQNGNQSPSNVATTETQSRNIASDQYPNFKISTHESLISTCSQGNPLACYSAGLIFQNQGKIDEAAKYYNHACDMQMRVACTLVEKP